MATVRNDLDSVVAHMPEVKDAVHVELETRAARVRAVLQAHRHTGALAANTTVRTNLVDSTVTMEDPAVLSINYGHKAVNGRWVPGIHAIEAGL
ncbi:hypothetical protein E0L36_26615 [Streptomyces sp. AJS327]|uniref:DUF5403 family protein n=1 Tax=Streptomyces sp. AJS327 TaxID=2545265 RepID=UPI0015DE41BA|nr:DUF5403 family protein [Streptomyces sp. AJS327]MBA0054294.1 hypothetical protein [Streptomyces sp. AJS327]